MGATADGERKNARPGKVAAGSGRLTLVPRAAGSQTDPPPSPHACTPQAHKEPRPHLPADTRQPYTCPTQSPAAPSLPPPAAAQRVSGSRSNSGRRVFPRLIHTRLLRKNPHVSGAEDFRPFLSSQSQRPRHDTFRRRPLFPASQPTPSACKNLLLRSSLGGPAPPQKSPANRFCALSFTPWQIRLRGSSARGPAEGGCREDAHNKSRQVKHQSHREPGSTVDARRFNHPSSARLELTLVPHTMGSRERAAGTVTHADTSLLLTPATGGGHAWRSWLRCPPGKRSHGQPWPGAEWKRSSSHPQPSFPGFLSFSLQSSPWHTPPAARLSTAGPGASRWRSSSQRLSGHVLPSAPFSSPPSRPAIATAPGWRPRHRSAAQIQRTNQHRRQLERGFQHAIGSARAR